MNKLYLALGIVAVVFLSSLFFLQGNNVETPQKTQPTFSQEKSFNLDVKLWSFTPNVIKVKKGTKVNLNFNVIQGNHGFMIPELGESVYLPQGEKQQLSFIADKPGMYTFYCNVPCGRGHSNMRGQIIVEA